MSATGVLLVSCPDRPGIVAAVASFVAAHGGNVIDLQQHTDHTDGAFFQRVEFELDHVDLSRAAIGDAFVPVAEDFGMQWTLRFSDERLRVGILVSKEPHCLHDLLNRWRTGELPIEIAVVASNHPDHAATAEWFGVDYVHAPIVDGDKPAQEAVVHATLAKHLVDVVVLARYMQVLSPAFCAEWSGRIINIHHSFLPAFQGARPYHQAHQRGVKLVGVTAHYATAELDDGPIIDQDVIRVTHRDDVDDLRRKGRDLEVAVLARAVRAHIGHRVLVYGRRTVVFE
ncbi:MAG TPA: formyltetrahydrofolate deformylase [Acidimicrobiales bacterium]|jgi:formyltetrahydrofolate deformylase|nr:formyltetrahydrofolate deformylase [Acidimicrobiales bacterium]